MLWHQKDNESGVMVCTPTKSGTRTLESYLHTKWDLFEKIKPLHRPSVPRDYESVATHRVLMVRHPQERLSSAFDYLNAHAGQWGWTANGCHWKNFDQFLEYHKSKWEDTDDWTRNYDFTANQFFDPDDTCEWVKLEEIDDPEMGMLAVLREMDVPIPDDVALGHVNKTVHKDREGRWNRRRYRTMANWLKPDIERFNYTAWL